MYDEKDKTIGVVVIAGPPMANCMAACLMMRNTLNDLGEHAGGLVVDCRTEEIPDLREHIPLVKEIMPFHVMKELTYHEPMFFEKRGRRPGQNTKPFYARR